MGFGATLPDPVHPGQVILGPGLTHGFLAEDRKVEFNAETGNDNEDVRSGHIACGKPLDDDGNQFEWLHSTADTDLINVSLAEHLCQYSDPNQIETYN
jgi:hypothetical protein